MTSPVTCSGAGEIGGGDQGEEEVPAARVAVGLEGSGGVMMEAGGGVRGGVWRGRGGKAGVEHGR